MKISQTTMNAGIVDFVKTMIDSIQNPLYKFLIGGMTGVEFLKNRQLDSMLGMFKTNDGYYDTDKIKKFFAEAFNATDGKLSIKLFGNQNSMLSMLVPPLNLNFTIDDANTFIQKLENLGPVMIES